MVDLQYIPNRGDLIWIDLDPTLGSEQAKRRPALVLSPAPYSTKTPLCLIVPVTSKVKGYAWEVPLPPELKTQGVILSDQVRSVSWRVRKISYIETVPPALVATVQAKYKNLLF
jgi:mRNA interferase MazF